MTKEHNPEERLKPTSEVADDNADVEAPEARLKPTADQE